MSGAYSVADVAEKKMGLTTPVKVGILLFLITFFITRSWPQTTAIIVAHMILHAIL
jgi:hypothetical protein